MAADYILARFCPLCYALVVWSSGERSIATGSLVENMRVEATRFPRNRVFVL